MAVRLTVLRWAGVAVVAAAPVLTGCSSEPTSPPTSAAADPATTATGAAAERPVALGESVSLTLEDGGSLTLTVEEISVLESCPGRATPIQEPELGHFVVLEVAAVAEAGAPETVPLQAGAFQLADETGAPQRVSTTDASWSCFDDADLVPAFVPPGEPVHGKIVLDSASPHGSVLYPLGEETLTWEY
jgi:hypothetical protein